MDDYAGIRQDITEIKSDVKDLAAAMTRLQVMMVGDYVKKRDFDTFRETNQTAHNTIVGWVIGSFGFILTCSAIVIAVIKA